MSTEEKKEKTAFPYYERNIDGDMHMKDTGMTLRDYFAAKAMTALLIETLNSENQYHPSYDEWIAEQSYSAADAMLKQREI